MYARLFSIVNDCHLQVGESLLARKELLHETALKEDMILSVMPKFIADQLMSMDKEKTADARNAQVSTPAQSLSLYPCRCSSRRRRRAPTT